MSDPIYDLYLTPGVEREKILRAIRLMARRAGLGKHGIDIRPKGSTERDEVETRVDLFAKEMRNKPELHIQLQGKARVNWLADVDLRSFSGKRVAYAIVGKRLVMPGKARRNRNEELRDKLKTARKELSSDRRPALPFEGENGVPINPYKFIRNVNASDLRSLLDRQYCDGITALKVLTMAVFAKKSHELNAALSPPEPETKQTRMKLGEPER